MTNRLVHALSPYLRQHADNPVDWQEWGADAFAEARRRDVPIFLSIGYAACHWCHVMAHESFEDPAIAEILNTGFVPIKVDREERPDVDAIYMDVTVALTGQGGWPMSVWLTPQGHAFHAGTYFPPTPHPQLPSFSQVLGAVAQAWSDRREQVLSGSLAITEELATRAQPPEPGTLAATDVDQAIGALAAQADDDRGGFGGAPKFPPSSLLDALVRRAAQGDGPVADEAWRLAGLTLTRMARGGIYDQLGGGFSRYSVDAGWVVPHFEKMLYDNALLISAYARAGAEARRRREAATAGLCDRVVTETVGWLLREMTTPQGGFAASLDADSVDAADGQLREGAFYAWTPRQLAEVLGADDGELAAQHFDVTRAGTFEHGASTLQLPRDPADGRSFADLQAALRAARDRRPGPARDDKVVAAWNGWAIASLVESAMLMNRPGWLAPARAAARAVLEVHLSDDDGVARLVRVSRDGVASDADGVAEDYAGMALGLLALAAATGERTWLQHALALLGTLDAYFLADDGGVHDASAVPSGGEQLVRRPRDLAENATPSGSSAALRAYRTAYRLTGERHWRERADAVARTLAPYVARAPRAAGWALADAVAELGARRPAEVAIVTGADDTHADLLTRAAWRDAPPGSVVVAGAPDDLPLLEGRTAVEDRTTAYVCHDGVCDLPVTGVGALQSRLR